MGLREKHFVEEVFNESLTQVEEHKAPLPSALPDEPKPSKLRRSLPRLEYYGAEREHMAAIEADPSNPRHHWNLMVIYEARKDYELAIKHVELYIEKGDPDNDGDIKKQDLLDKLKLKLAKPSRRSFVPRLFLRKNSAPN